MYQNLNKGDTILKHLVGEEFQPSKELKAIKGLTWANDEKHHWYVAIKDGRMLGCVGLFMTGDSARFKTDAVIPEARGQGLYRQLFALREALALSLGAATATTFSNQNSRKMYEANGFVAHGTESHIGVMFMRKTFDKRPKSW